jgi:preprotein translocase subunit SecG
LIRDVPRLINPIAHTHAVRYAADIYLQANHLDSAYMYANELIHTNNPVDKLTGYHTVLSSSLVHKIPADSIIPYVIDYRISIESLLDQNGNQQALLQTSIYNYNIHERERQKAEQAKLNLQRSITCILAIVFILIIIVFYLRYRNKAQLLKLHIALENINKLTEKLNIKSQEEATTVVKTGNVAELRLQLRNKLI